MEFSYKFPVVRGVQACREYYIAMVPLKMIPRLFPVDEEYVLPENRAQRKLNASRIPEIKRYILDNRDTYVFSALAASIDGEYRFIPTDHDLGVLEVSMDAKFLINDGQHRKAAILGAIDEDPELSDETISVVFYEDKGLARSQQMFTDLNKHAVKTSNSIAELYDSRDDLAVLTRNVIAKIPFLDEYTDKERDILGKFSSSLFTLNTFYNAIKRILRKNSCNQNVERFLVAFWSGIADHMTPWNDLIAHDLSKVDLREKYIAVQAVVIQSLGRVGGYLFDHPEYPLEKHLVQIERINWRRNSKQWQLRTIKTNGRMINNETAILLTANAIKKSIGLPLTEDETEREEKAFFKNS